MAADGSRIVHNHLEMRDQYYSRSTKIQSLNGAGGTSVPSRTLLALLPVVLLGLTNPAAAQQLASFGVLAGSAVTNTGATVISGNVGVSPGIAITGLAVVTPDPGLVTGTIHANDAVAIRAQNDLTTLYNFLAAQPSTSDLTGQNLGGLTLTPGVYSFSSAAALTGTLTLDAQNNPNAVFIFNIESTLTTSVNAKVTFINTADASAQGGNVFFRVGSSATLGTGTDFVGQIVALSSISFTDDADILCGAALARNGAVTLINNDITVCTVVSGSFDDVLDGEDDEDTATDNAHAIADALDAFVAGGGVLPQGFAILAATLTPEQLAEALAQLAGETATGVAPTGMQGMDNFITLVTGGRGGPGMSVVSGPELPERGTVSVMGYAPAPAAPARDPFAAFDTGAPTETSRLWDIWMAGFGGYSQADGNADAGSRQRTSRDFGLAIGVDLFLDTDTRLGLALAAGGTNFVIADDAGGGRSEMVQAAIHGRKAFEDFYVAGALGYGVHAVTTERTVTIAGIDRFSAQFDAQSYGGSLEAGYRLDWLTPYAALRGQAYATPDYAETTEAGASTFALDYAAQTSYALRSEIGARAGWETQFDSGTTLALSGGIAWAHDLRSDTDVEATFQALGDAPFTIAGADAPADLLLLSAGAQLTLPGGFALGGALDAAYASTAQAYKGSVTLAYSW